jgi:hypothetical protein
VEVEAEEEALQTGSCRPQLLARRATPLSSQSFDDFLPVKGPQKLCEMAARMQLICVTWRPNAVLRFYCRRTLSPCQMNSRRGDVNTGSGREAVQIKHPASGDVSQLNVNVESAGDVLAVENIHKSFGENEVLKGISLAAKK